MARKSRKQNNVSDALSGTESSRIQAAAYIRLSMEDQPKRGNSIANQQLIIKDYIKEHPDFELFDTYIDSGVSGTTFERPSFQRMMRDAELGRIDCIFIKDLSRLSRSVIDGGYYIEKVFPRLGIRLISITDNYDSKVNQGGIDLPLINLVNEVYAFDISRKTRSTSRQAMRDGIYVGGQPPYGFIRSPEKRGKLVIDESAAKIVHQIFTWAANGVSAYEIARRLNASQVLSPNNYKAVQRLPETSQPAGSGKWLAGTVTRILNNEIYLGRLVQGKTKAVNFKRQAAPEDEWVYADRSHEAIISQELFDAVRSNRKANPLVTTSERVQYSQNFFKRKIYCAVCGGSLERTKNHSIYIPLHYEQSRARFMCQYSH